MAAKGETVTDLTGIMVEATLRPDDYLIIAPVVLPILFGAGLLMLRRRTEWHGRLALLGGVLLVFATFGLLAKVLGEGPVNMAMGRWLPPFGISFSVDRAGALFAFTSSLIALAGLVFSLADTSALERRYGFYPFFMLMMAGVNGAFLTGDIFNLYVWFEVLLISSFGLIVLGSERAQLDGTIKYAFLNLVATMMFLTAIGYLYGVLGTLNMADILLKLRETPLEGPVVTIGVLFMLAFAMKAAAFPLNFWLPASYHTPKIVVSAVFAGLLTKVGIYALLRVGLMLFAGEREILAPAIAWFAGLTMIVGVVGALAQSDIRRLLGYLVISGIGTMLAGLAIASQTAVTGTLVYAVHSMIVMTALYFAVGYMGSLTDGLELRVMGGLYKAAPLVAFCFLVLAFSVSGLPPTSGFWGKFVLVKSAVEIGAWWLALAILVSGLLTTIAIFRVWIFAFWRGGPEGTRDGAEAWKVETLEPGYRRYAMLALLMLTAATLGIGLVPEPLLSLAADAANGLLFPRPYVDSVLGGGS